MKKGVLSLAALAFSAAAMAQFTPGRLVVVVAGTGAASLDATATPAFLQEYTTAGVAGVNVPLPTAVAGSNRICTLRGSSTSEGFLARSVDGRYLTMMGFDAPVGTAAVSTTDAAVINRVVARIDSAGVIDTSTTFAAYTGTAPSSNGDPRAAATVDGTAFWTNGNASPSGNGGQWYSTLGVAGTQISTNVPNGRVVKIFNGQVYVSSGSALLTGVGALGTGLPTTAGQTVTTYISTAGTGVGFGSPYDFYFSDANTCYIADDRSVANGGGIQKYTYNTGTSAWEYQYTLNNSGVTAGTRGITGVVDAGMVTLYTTTNGDLYTVMDMGVASPWVLLASAATNTAFRGIAWAPAAPPVTIEPTGGTPGPGSTIGGTPADMLISDDVRWQIRPGAILVATADPIVVRIVGTAPGTTPSALSVTVESSATVSGVRQIVEAQKADNTYTVLETFDPLPFGANPDRSITLSIANPTQYIRAGNEVAVRIKSKNLTAVLVYPWRYRIDRLYWTYTP